MNADAKANLGILALVSIIGLMVLLAYKLKDIGTDGIKSFVNRINGLLSSFQTEPTQTGFKLDAVTIGVFVVLALTLVQIFRLRK
jgi:hypothetical protein